MKVKFGGMIVGGRGKFAGLVGSHNKGGDYFRQFVVPTNPATPSQSAVRNDFADSSQGWRALTQAQMIQWNDAVQNYKKTNVFGDLKTLSGKALFQRLNGNLLAAGAATISAPLLPAGALSFTAFSAAYAAGAQTATLTYAPGTGATNALVLEATPSNSAGVFNAKNQFRIVEVLGAADASPYVFTASYLAKFGAVGAAGSKIFTRASYVTLATGERSTYESTSSIVGA